MALAVRARAHPRGDRAVVLDLHRAVLAVERERRADLEVRRDTDAEQLGVAALAAGGLLGAQLGVAGLLDRDVERLRVLAAVVGRAETGDRQERERLGRDEVGLADLDRVDAELVGGDVERALHEVDRLRPARAAVRGDGRGVRDRGLPVEVDLGDDVHVLRHHLREERQERADGRVRARVGERAHAQAADLAVPLHAELDVVDVAAAVPHRDHVLGAGLRPLHRAAEQERGLGDDEVLDDHPGLGAEATADRRVRAAHDLGVEPELGGELVAHAVRALGRGPEREPALGLAGNGHDPGRLHRHRRDPLVDDAHRHHDVGVVEHALDGPGPHRVRDVRALRLEHDRRVGQDRGFGVDDRRQRVVVDDHGFGGVDRLGLRLRDHHRHDVADEPHAVPGERRPVHRGRQHHEAVVLGQVEVVGGVHRHDAGHADRVARVDALEHGVGDRRAHERDVEQPRRRRGRRSTRCDP